MKPAWVCRYATCCSLTRNVVSSSSPIRGVIAEEVVERSGAQDVDGDAVDLGALVDGHLRLRARARSDDLGRVAAREIQDAGPLPNPRRLTLMNSGAGPLEPAGRHPALFRCHTVANRSQSPASRHSSALDEPADLGRSSWSV